MYLFFFIIILNDLTTIMLNLTDRWCLLNKLSRVCVYVCIKCVRA